MTKEYISLYIYYWNFFSFTEHAFDCQRQAFKLSELESLSLTIKSMFCEREKVPVININQQNDKSTQESHCMQIKYDANNSTQDKSN